MTVDPAGPASPTDPDSPVRTVTVYWRQRCPYCIRLRRKLRHTGLPVTEVNIWQDGAAAARVREITGGDETVPTVVVGSRSMVNPDLDQVLAAVRDEAPQLLDDTDANGTGQPTGTAPSGTRAGLLASLGLGVVWIALAAWHPTVTYHLAPALVAAAAPVMRRLQDGVLSRRQASAMTGAGLAVALVVTAVLAGWGKLEGPTVTGGSAALAETLIAAVAGALVAWAATARRWRRGS